MDICHQNIYTVHQLFLCGTNLARHLRAGEGLIASLPGGGGSHIAGDAGRAALISDCLFLDRLSVHTDEPSGKGLVPSSIKAWPFMSMTLGSSSLLYCTAIIRI